MDGLRKENGQRRDKKKAVVVKKHGQRITHDGYGFQNIRNRPQPQRGPTILVYYVVVLITLLFCYVHRNRLFAMAKDMAKVMAKDLFVDIFMAILLACVLLIVIFVLIKLKLIDDHKPIRNDIDAAAAGGGGGGDRTITSNYITFIIMVLMLTMLIFIYKNHVTMLDMAKELAMTMVNDLVKVLAMAMTIFFIFVVMISCFRLITGQITDEKRPHRVDQHAQHPTAPEQVDQAAPRRQA